MAAEKGEDSALAGLGDIDHDMDLLPLPAAPKARAPSSKAKASRRAQLLAAQADESSDGSVIGDASQEAPAGLAVVAPSHAAGALGEGLAVAMPECQGRGAHPEAQAEGEEARRDRHQGAPEFILGAQVSYVPGRQTDSHTYADRLSVRCPNLAHHRCSKSRSIALLQDQLGPRSAEGFLGAWLAKAHTMEQAAHRKYMPTLQEMRQFLAEHA